MVEDEEIELEPWAVGLLPDDALFVREFLIDLNAYQAMIRCGHTEKYAQANAWRTIRRAKIAKAIASAMEERADALRLTAKTVLAEAWRCYTACVADKNWKDAGKFLEMIGKHVDVQAFRNQVGLSNPDGSPLDFDLSDMPTDEKRAALALLKRFVDPDQEPDGANPGARTLN